MTDRELMKWALDALDGYARNCRCEGGGGTTDAAETLRARLAKQGEPDWAAAGFRPKQPEQLITPGGGLPNDHNGVIAAQPEQEPVAWMVVNGEGKIEETSHYKPSVERWLKYDETRRLVPLYTAQKIFCGCGDQIMPDDGAECGTCVTARNAVRGEWQGLTDEEIWDIYCDAKKQTDFGWLWNAHAIEAKLKEKNT